MSELLKSRYDEVYLLGQRNQRLETFGRWHTRVDQTDALVRGEFQVVFPDQTLSGGKPVVANLADTMPRDVARIASEVMPSYHAPVKGDSKDAETAAAVRGVIGEGYFHVNRFDLLRPQLIMDILITGTAFVVSFTDEGPYPRLMRVDPRFCYPDVYNGIIQDLLVVQPMKIRVADRVFPGLGLGAQAEKFKPGTLSDSVEVWSYYGAEQCVQAVSLMLPGGKPIGDAGVGLVKTWEPGIGRAPVAFGQLPSPDGGFRGLIDQVGGSLIAKNRAVTLALEYSSQMTYSPWEAKGIINSDTPPGPNTIYQHDPNATTETFMRRVAPAESSQQLWGLIGYLDNEQRDSLSYPATRQGEVPVSQGSGSFLNATMGSLTSLVRESQRILTDMQERIGGVMFQLDQRFLDFEKQLLHSVGRKRTYVPSRDIGQDYQLSVEYGVSAGLDRLHADVRLMNFYSAGLLPAELTLSQVDFVEDARGAYEKRQEEEVDRIILQRFAGDPSTSLDVLISASLRRKREGGSLLEAIEAVRIEEQTQAQNQPQPGGQTAQTDLTSAPQEAGSAQLALLKGGRAAAPQQAGTGRQGAPIAPGGGFSPPPIQRVFVRG